MSNFKKQFSENFASLEVPAALDHITPEDLSANFGGENHIVIDVRQAAEFAKGSIAGSRNVDLDSWTSSECPKFVEELTNLYKSGSKRPRVTFISLQSPDIDSAAALHFAEIWDELPEVKDKSFPPSNEITSILLGGFFHWLQLYRTNPALTLNYDGATWEKLIPRAETPETKQ